MSDVLKLAAQRRDRLQKEVDRLNAFIALGETIAREEKSVTDTRPEGDAKGNGPHRLVNNG